MGAVMALLMQPSVLEAAVVSISVTAVLIAMFQQVRSEWPNSYFGPAESLTALASRSPLRFLVFRAGPPFVVFVAVGSYATSPVTTLWSCGVLYSVTSAALSVRSSLKRERGAVRLNLSRALVLLVITGIVLSCVPAGLGVSGWLRDRVPPLASVLSDLVAAVLAALLVVVYVRFTDRSSHRSQRTSRDLPKSLVTQIVAISLERSVDPRLALAIAIAEDEQRPRWVRGIESVAARVVRRRSFTTGLFQVSAPMPLGDIESCELAMDRMRGTFPLLANCGDGVEWSVKAAAERHNPDVNFAEMVSSIYDYLPNWTIEGSSEEGPDGRPLLEVAHVGRFRDLVRIRGTAWWEPALAVVVEQRVAPPTDPTSDVYLGSPVNNSVEGGAPSGAVDHSRLGGNSGETVARLASPGPGRVGWFADVSTDCAFYAVSSSAESDGCFTRIELLLDLRWATVERDLSLKDAVDGAAGRVGPRVLSGIDDQHPGPSPGSSTGHPRHAGTITP